jgi:hypothetical protein
MRVFRGFWAGGGPTCAGDPVKRAHECAPFHRVSARVRAPVRRTGAP